MTIKQALCRKVGSLRRGYLQKRKPNDAFLFPKYPGGVSAPETGAAPPNPEEEAKPDDEAKDLRRHAAQ
jgi:hypothetical protein